MSDKICKCGHSESEHGILNEQQTSVCFHKTEDEMSITEYCTCMDFEENIDESIKKLKEEHAFMSSKIDELNTPMPCGHLARYAVNSDEGTGHCLLCLVISMTHTDDIKIVSEIAEIISHE